MLCEREWLDFGHKFADRCGHAVGKVDPSERCPVFLQWLDCVHQLLHQFPCSFEFSQAYLVCWKCVLCVCVCEVCFGLFCEMWQPLFSGSHIKYSALPMPVLCLYFVLSLTCSSLMFFCVLSFTKEHILCIDMHKRRCKINISIVTGSLLSV